MSTKLARPTDVTWHQFEHHGNDVLLTARGHDLWQADAELGDRVSRYFGKALGHTAASDLPGVRTFFGKDTNSHVYTLDENTYGHSLLMKESNGHSMAHAVARMERIRQIIEKQRLEGNLPGWIDAPAHHAVITSSTLPSQYVLMEGIDSGINVRDIVDFDASLNAKERAGVTALIGAVDPALQQEIATRYQNAEELLSDAIGLETYQSPTRLLSDWHPGNVVLEQLKRPIDGSSWKLWVIDQ